MQRRLIMMFLGPGSGQVLCFRPVSRFRRRASYFAKDAGHFTISFHDATFLIVIYFTLSHYRRFIIIYFTSQIIPLRALA